MRCSAKQLRGVFSCSFEVLNVSFCRSWSPCAFCQNCCCGPLLHCWPMLLWLMKGKESLVSQFLKIYNISWEKLKPGQPKTGEDMWFYLRIQCCETKETNLYCVLRTTLFGRKTKRLAENRSKRGWYHFFLIKQQRWASTEPTWYQTWRIIACCLN